MTIKIDRMDTTVELLPPSRGAASAPVRQTTGVESSSALREAVGQLLAEELDQFVRNRGLSR